MTDYSLQARPMLDNFSQQSAGVTWREVTGYDLLSIAPYRHNRDDVETLLQTELGVGLPDPGKAGFSENDGAVSIISAARDQWFVRTSEDREGLNDLKADLLPLAAVTDQSDAWLQIELLGKECAYVLERLFPIDLNPDHFPVGHTARTVVEHIGVIITRLPEAAKDERCYLILTPASSARSFMHALMSL